MNTLKNRNNSFASAKFSLFHNLFSQKKTIPKCPFPLDYLLNLSIQFKNAIGIFHVARIANSCPSKNKIIQNNISILEKLQLYLHLGSSSNSNIFSNLEMKQVLKKIYFT